MIHISEDARPRCSPSGAVTILVCSVFALLIAACGAGAESSGDERATVPSTSSTASDTRVEPGGLEAANDTVGPTVEEEVEAAYLEANRVFFSLMEDPEQDLEDLEATRTGESFEHVRAAVERRRESGERSTYPTGHPVAEVLEVEVDGEKALLRACEPNDAVVTDGDGAVINDDVVARRTEVQLELIDGRWAVAAEYEIKKFVGSRSCDV